MIDKRFLLYSFKSLFLYQRLKIDANKFQGESQHTNYPSIHILKPARATKTNFKKIAHINHN